MSIVTKPILLDETGQAIVSALGEIKDAIDNGGTGDNPVKIIVITPPAKTEYSLLDNIDLTGIAVGAVFSNNSVIDITDQCVFSPEHGSTINTIVNNINISWAWHATEKVFTTTQEINTAVPSWETGTDEQIAIALDAHYAGDINITDYWAIGDERTVHLSAMSAIGVGDSHAAQDVTMVLMNAGGKTLTTPIKGVTECAFIVGQKNAFNEESQNHGGGYINPTPDNTGGWNNCARRTWCNSIYRMAIPESLRGIFKQYENITGDDSDTSTNVTSNDYFALPSEKEVFGSNTYSDATAEASNVQFDYYKSSANRIKKYGDNGVAFYWFERSLVRKQFSTTAFCLVNNEGAASLMGANASYGIAPFGVI